MAFTTGVPASLDDFLSALVSFATTHAGFTNAGVVTSSSATGSRNVYRLQKGGISWNFCRNTGNNLVQAAMSYTPFASGVSLANTGAAVGVTGAQQYWTEMNTWAFTGPYTGHYFFTDGTCVHAVIEVAAGIFNHLSFGNVTKTGTWTGGEYLTAGWYGVQVPGTPPLQWRDAIINNTSLLSYSHRPFDCEQPNNAGFRYGYMRTANTSSTSDFGRMGYAASDAPVCGFVGASTSFTQGTWSMYGNILRDSPSVSTGRTPLLPGVMRMRESVSGLLRVAGTVPHIAILKMSNDMNPKDIINSDWQVFPMTCRTGGDRTLASTSYEFALAYRRV